MPSEIFKQGQQAYERGETFVSHNPFPCTDDRHYEWFAGWYEREIYYRNLSREELMKEDEEYNRQLLIEKEAEEKKKEIIKAEKRYKKSKKGRAEAAGQGTLF